MLLYQSRSNKYPSGYFASAWLTHADLDMSKPNYLVLRLADIVEFREPVPVPAGGPVPESYARHDDGKLHGRRFAEDFRFIPSGEFSAILALNDFDQPPTSLEPSGMLENDDTVRQRVWGSAWHRDLAVRTEALPLYNFQCAFSGRRLLSVDGRTTGLEVCHAKPVEWGGPDTLSNLLVATRDFHYLWDSGVIDILDDHTWVVVGSSRDPNIASRKGPSNTIYSLQSRTSAGRTVPAGTSRTRWPPLRYRELTWRSQLGALPGSEPYVSDERLA
ncbi:hypothetical protein [Devosia sp. 1566]|uniref:HNH endonuclease signature motif containing protein n=1 Tax=Devosia sp. 1566 TaxID=2499144 RepID=UPI000FDB335C|nr:hypothetical protein [Devosia sp. 1566]